MQKEEHNVESGEEALEALIKEAGEAARKRKRKVMDEHAKKLYDAVRGKVDVGIPTEPA